jgi:hypothetical protein
MMATKLLSSATDKNRYKLIKVINCIKFYGLQELQLRGHNGKEVSYNTAISWICYKPRHTFSPQAAIG